MNEEQKVRLGTAETVLGVSWFLLDGSWLMGWRLLAHLLIAVALAAAVARFIWLEEGPAAMQVAASESAWLAMNAFWVVGDLNKLPWCIVAAKLCLLGGLLILARAFVANRDEIKSLVFRPMRRLRVLRQS